MNKKGYGRQTTFSQTTSNLFKPKYRPRIWRSSLNLPKGNASRQLDSWDFYYSSEKGPLQNPDNRQGFVCRLWKWFQYCNALVNLENEISVFQSHNEWGSPFRINGAGNKQNYRFWGSDSLQLIHQQPLHKCWMVLVLETAVTPPGLILLRTIKAD